VAPIEDKVKEIGFRRFSHVKRNVDASVRRHERINLPECRRGRRSPKKSL